MTRFPRRFGLVTGTVAFLVATATANPAQSQATPEKYLELLRSDLRTAKTEVMTDALELSDADGAAFWPIYREYDTELAKLGDRRVALIKQYAATYGSTTNEQAAMIAKEYFSLQDERMKLRKKYFDKVQKATSSIVATRFIQVEGVVANLVDLQIGAEVPLME